MKNTNTSPKASSKKEAGRGRSAAVSSNDNKHFFRRIMVACTVALLGLGLLTGSLYLLDKNGKLRDVQSHFSSHRSSSKKKGDYYDSSRSDKKVTGPIDDFDPDFDDSGYIDDTDERGQTEYILPDSKDAYDLNGYTVILDPGHGGRDTGCVFPFNDPQYNECDFNLTIAKRVKKELESRGATVYMTRTDNSWVSLYNRIAQTHLICLDIAEQEGCLPFSKARADELRDLLEQSIYINEDTVASGGMGIMVGSGVGEDLNDLFEMEYQLEKVLFLSIHLNSSESRTLHGNSIFYVTDDSVIESERRQMNENSEFQRSDFPIRDEYYGRHNEDNYLLACCLYDNIVGNIPAFETNAHPVNADNYAVLREHGLTGALVEVAFLSDDNDRAMLQDDDTIDTVASSISDAAKMYFIQKGI